MTKKQLAAEYRVTYQQHQSVVTSYSEGMCDANTLRSSANGLKQLRAAYKVAGEAG